MFLKFWCHFFFFHTPFFDCVPVFRGGTQPIEKNLLDFQIQNFYTESFEQKIYLKTIIIPEACKTLKIDGVFWSNLKYFNKFWVQQRTLNSKKIWKFHTFHIPFVCLLLYVPYMQNFNKENACLQCCCCWTSFGNFIYTTIVCNDTSLSWRMSNFKPWS